MRTLIGQALLILFFCHLHIIGLQAEALPSPALTPSVPAAFLDSLRSFRPEGPPDWGYEQSTQGDGKARIERYDPGQPESQRWSLLSLDSRAPTAEEIRDYRSIKMQRSSLFHAPRLQEQLDPGSAKVLEDTASLLRIRYRLRPGDASDRTSAHLTVELTWMKASRTITRVVIASFEPFSPVFGISLNRTRTELHYAEPREGRPSLPERYTIEVRGRAYWIKGIEQDLTITFSNPFRIAAAIIPNTPGMPSQ